MGRGYLFVHDHPLGKFVPLFEADMQIRHVPDSTRRVVSHAIRRVLTALPEITEAGLLDVVDGLTPSQRGPTRSAWRGFAAFVGTQGVEVPTFPPGAQGRPALRVSSMDLLLHALQRAYPRVTASLNLTRLRWREVHRGIDSATIVIGSIGTIHVSPTFVAQLAKGGFPDLLPTAIPGHAPLFPNSPGSMVPLPATRIDRAIQRAQDALDEQRVLPWTAPPSIMKLPI